MKTIFNRASRLTPPDNAVALRGIGFRYPGTEVFRDLDVSIERSALTVATGSNGSGKSTLLGLLAGVLRPTRGEVHVDTTDVALAVQRSHVTDTFPITAREAVMMGRWRRLGLLRRPTTADHDVVDRWLDELALGTLRHRRLGELSGGQRQRVLLAQAFAQEAPLLLLDEPTTGLDAATCAAVIEHLRSFASVGTTVVVATHDGAVIDAADHRLDLNAFIPH